MYGVIKLKEKSEYVIIKIPADLVKEIDAVLGKHGYRSRAEFVKDAVRALLRHYAASSTSTE